jgi:hypothetical protein
VLHPRSIRRAFFRFRGCVLTKLNAAPTRAHFFWNGRRLFLQVCFCGGDSMMATYFPPALLGRDRKAGLELLRPAPLSVGPCLLVLASESSWSFSLAWALKSSTLKPAQHVRNYYPRGERGEPHNCVCTADMFTFAWIHAPRSGSRRGGVATSPPPFRLAIQSGYISIATRVVLARRGSWPQRASASQNR